VTLSDRGNGHREEKRRLGAYMRRSGTQRHSRITTRIFKIDVFHKLIYEYVRLW